MEPGRDSRDFFGPLSSFLCLGSYKLKCLPWCVSGTQNLGKEVEGGGGAEGELIV